MSVWKSREENLGQGLLTKGRTQKKNNGKKGQSI